MINLGSKSPKSIMKDTTQKKEDEIIQKSLNIQTRKVKIVIDEE